MPSHEAQSNRSFGLYQQKFPPGLSTKLCNLKINMSFFAALVSDYVGKFACSRYLHFYKLKI